MELYLYSPIRLHCVMLSEVEDVFMTWYLVKHKDNFIFTYLKMWSHNWPEKTEEPQAAGIRTQLLQITNQTRYL
jgi:hypothetical protein